MKAEQLIVNIGTLMTPKDLGKLVRGKAMQNVLTMHNAYIAIREGRIIEIGEGEGKNYQSSDTKIIDAGGKLVTPGFIDSHTHVVHGGSREHEFDLKLKGVPYLDILKQGGGIHSTVKATKQASVDALYKQAFKSLNRMLAFGVTTIEGKSGYGLERDTEIKQLNVQKMLDRDHPIDIVSTFLGAHALPKDYESNREGFIQKMIDILPEVKQKGLAEYVDIFCEDGAFTRGESLTMLTAAKKLGFKLKIHADEVVPLGGVRMAAKLGAASADHLMAIDEDGLDALASYDTVATVLPSTSFNLRSDFAPVRTMIERNLAVAVSTDYNPGSAPSENFLFVLNLAALYLRMTPEEILTAATINPAYAIGRADTIGSLEVGKHADFVVFDAENFPYVLYHYGINHVQAVYKNGVCVMRNTHEEDAV